MPQKRTKKKKEILKKKLIYRIDDYNTYFVFEKCYFGMFVEKKNFKNLHASQAIGCWKCLLLLVKKLH